MDLLVSVPLASYLLAPSAFTSWSTSLNLLFFYMTWSTLVLSHPPLTVHLAGITFIRLALWLIPSLLSLIVDLGVPSLAEDLKFGGRSALPPRDVTRLGKMLGLALLNMGILTAVEAAASWLFAWGFKETEFTTGTTLPLPWHMAKHIAILLTARETLHYYIHRYFLHSPGGNNITSFIAEKHACYGHARRGAPFSLQLFTDHPAPLILHRFLPLYLPAIVLRPHLLTYLLFFALCTGEETLAMSGYSVAPGIIMGGIAQRSSSHYASGGKSNFGAWGLLDWVHGSGSGRDVIEDVKAEADKHHVKERSAQKADEGAGMLQSGIDALTNGSPRRSGRKRTPKRGE